MKVTVIAHPGSKLARVEKDQEGRIHVYVAARAQEGKANAALQAALAEYFHVAKSQVVLLRGQKGKQKIFQIL